MQVVVDNVSKHFAGAIALQNVSFEVCSGSIHGLVGENGAGKSTLGKLVGGVLQPNDGRVIYDGDDTLVSSPHEAIERGIAAVQQELVLCQELTVAENICLGRESTTLGFLRNRESLREFNQLRDELGFELDGRARLGSLSIADQQQVEILKALSRNARLIVLDEPTSSLTPTETEHLHQVVKRLAKERGTTFIYVSHFLDHILSSCDAVTVLRNGKHVQTGPAKDETRASLAAAMLGRDLSDVFPPKKAPPPTSAVKLSTSGLTRLPVFEDINIHVQAGEIVGIAGLVGSGRSEVLRSIFGADEFQSGMVAIDGYPVGRHTPITAMRNGLAMVPESRREQGLFLEHSIAENISLINFSELRPFGIVNHGKEAGEIRKWAARLNIKCTSTDALVSSLSGGNQQKVLFAKWLAGNPSVMLLDEPTRGVDIGAKSEIYNLVVELAARGMAILIVSSEIEELVGLCHRMYIMREGSIVGEKSAEGIEFGAILRECLGVYESDLHSNT
ncbi:sugar ABC transporter ATP-binding protein [Mesorhizobium sp. M0293]|uniref:sugar ABC transporter ATP-binding protein n=1 Tax=Mesorhizobium sp. M0293 TaxID=2956930 RepID=UPI00333B1310